MLFIVLKIHLKLTTTYRGKSVIQKLEIEFLSIDLQIEQDPSIKKQQAFKEHEKTNVLAPKDLKNRSEKKHNLFLWRKALESHEAFDSLKI